ncbi:hypothetical protein TH61_04925 [Rufibacter sp. DG15C]|uniref:DUF4271 domain-containing protein n=1 Tax=Rufibacter sp. DG15C TaxID=1379909 RepID=UPI00078E7B46|nr:DUF4271 domain-containing protein [Rufibacter sp. DG15C]AMM50650.1 hypothetical protein TH61_04925 [Rufibacter sp. DG15C]
MRFWGLLLGFWLMWGVAWSQAVPLKPLISSDWLIYQPQSNQLVPYLPEFHDERQALYQWVKLDAFTSPVVEFAARQQLCVFLDNKLVFVADSTAKYTVDLSKWMKPGQKYLLSVWHPLQQPDYHSFKLPEVQVAQSSFLPQKATQFLTKPSSSPRSVLILFMVIVGLIYGSLRMTFPTDFSSIFKLSNFAKEKTLEEGLLAKPIGNWSSILFVLAFSLSFALLIVAIHRDIEDLALLNQLFTVTQADLILKIILYALLVFSFVVFKYLFLQLMGFIFGVTEVVLTQYREFLRTLLALGVFLPLILLLHLGLSKSAPLTIYWIANLSVAVLLIFTVFRTFLTISKKYSLQNLHLFSYICATEVIPLMILLKLIVFV